MKKLIFLMIGLLLIGSLFVNAEPRMVLTDVITNEEPLEPLSWWENFLNIFSREQFILGQQELNTRTFQMYVSEYRFVSPYFDKTYGEKCKNYDYVRLYVGDSKTGVFRNVFDDDWRIEFPGEYLNLRYACAYGDCTNQVYMAQYRNWFLNAVDGNYLGYHCIKAPMEAEIISSSTSIPSSSKIGNTIKVTTTVEFKGDGRYYVEAGLNKPSESRFSKLGSREVSACDGSVHYDGKWVDVTSGDKKSFTFYFKDYGVQASYVIDLVVTNGCKVGPNAISNYKQFDQESGSIIITSTTPTPTQKYSCSTSGVCTKDPDGGYTDPDCKGECTTPSNLAPTIVDIKFQNSDVDYLQTVGPGDNMPLRVEIRYPLGWNLKEYAESLGMENTNKLMMEVGVYNKDWAYTQNWIVQDNWWDRLWTVSEIPTPCKAKEAQFVNTYDLTTQLVKFDFKECTTSSKYYYPAEGACLTTFILADDLNTLEGDHPIAATVPSRSAKLDGVDMYNARGEYTMVVGLYHDCGEGYLPGKWSWWKSDIKIGAETWNCSFCNPETKKCEADIISYTPCDESGRHECTSDVTCKDAVYKWGCEGTECVENKDGQHDNDYCDHQCGIQYDLGAPTIQEIVYDKADLEGLSIKSGGGIVPVQIVIKTPLGYDEFEHARDSVGKGDATPKLKLELAVYNTKILKNHLFIHIDFIQMVWI